MGGRPSALTTTHDCTVQDDTRRCDTTQHDTTTPRPQNTYSKSNGPVATRQRKATPTQRNPYHHTHVTSLSNGQPIPWRRAAALPISVVPIPYAIPPVENLKNFMTFCVKVPVLSLKMDVTFPNSSLSVVARARARLPAKDGEQDGWSHANSCPIVASSTPPAYMHILIL